MDGLRRTSSTLNLDASRAQLDLRTREVALAKAAFVDQETAAQTAGVPSKRAAADGPKGRATRQGKGGKLDSTAKATRGAAQAKGIVEEDQDSQEQTAAAAKAGSRNAARAAARTGGRVAKGGARAVRGGIVAAQKRAATASTVKATKGTVQSAAALGRVAASVTRGAAAAAGAIKAAVAVVVAAVSSTPIMAIVAGVVVAIVAVLSIVSWLPGITSSNSQRDDRGYPVGVAPGPWGGHENGRIPGVLLAPIPWAPDHSLRADATASLTALNVAFTAKFGKSIQVNDAYRDLAGQREMRDYWCNLGKCGNAAVPGTSNHGWALAADLGSGINTFGTREYEWMKANGPLFGWEHPAWAEPGGSNPEAWHWDFWGWVGGDDVDADSNNPFPRGEAQLYANEQMTKVFGLTPDVNAQWVCLQQLWTNESGWKHTAKNPTSGAYGIPQALPGNKMASFGSDWKTNPKTQVDWGMDYIKTRYGTACQAWNTWQGRDPHWY